MFKHVIVPVDLGHPEPAHRAIAIAKKILEPGGTLTLLHVIAQMPTYVAAELHSDLYENAAESAKRALQELVERDQLSPSTEIRVVRGSVYRKILEDVTAPDTQAIVMAAHNPRFTDYLIGSTAAQVVKHAQCSVFVVRHAEDTA
ncbi:MAG: universal stress protein [Burkholderiaceae bacterium]